MKTAGTAASRKVWKLLHIQGPFQSTVKGLSGVF